jgi:uncharacterized protein (UPF0332 family)
VTAQSKLEVEANLRRAGESLGAARTLVESGFCDDGCSRAYYAVFYAATAALLAEGARFSKHAGVINGVHRRLVKSGRLSVELGRELNWLFDLRLVGDYGETRHVPPGEAERALEIAEQLVEALKGLIIETVGN